MTKLKIGIVAMSVFIAGCAAVSSVTAPFRDADTRWADYKSWTKVGDGDTGDPTNFLGNLHKGPDGYRSVFVNDVGAEVLQGDGPYVYPVGTVVVKEQFDNKADYEADRKAGHTVSLKVSDDAANDSDNWIWADSYKATAKASQFCSGCHTIAAGDDFVFTNQKLIDKHSQ